MPPNISTPLPTEFLPTAVALTLAASGASIQPVIVSEPTDIQSSPDPFEDPATSAPTQSFQPTLTFTQPPASTSEPTSSELLASPDPSTSTPVLTPTQVPSSTETPAPIPQNPLAPTPSLTPAPPIPDARIQIYRLGALSKIISPLDVSLRLTCDEGKVIRIDLYGEDGRLLARSLRTYNNIPWGAARIGLPLDFEILSAAELARLVISAEDVYGRMIEVNSMDLVLLSQGMTELNPPSGMQQRIIIQDPVEKALIQNSSLIVSGRARPATDQPLRVMLVGEDGRVLGQRLAGLSVSVPGDYGHFIAEVPYDVDEITPALLVVYEDGGTMSDFTFLTSIHVTLAP